VKLVYANSPDELDYKILGIDTPFILDSTGVWRDRDGLSQHLSNTSATKVLLTAPGKGCVKNIVHGINDHEIQSEDRIISAASCTTNAIAPVLRVISDKFGIVSVHVETVHAYTNDQNLLDNFHSKERRGRAAPLNILPTETGAAKAIGKVIPELRGKLTASSLRVPVPNVSLAILNLKLVSASDRDSINEYVKTISRTKSFQQQISYSKIGSVVSSDIVGSESACVFDAHATIVSGDNCVLYLWYDNEMGYCHQVIRCLDSMREAPYGQLETTSSGL